MGRKYPELKFVLLEEDIDQKHLVHVSILGLEDEYAGLTISCQQDQESRKYGDSHNWRIYYRNAGDVDLTRLHRMVRLLRSVEKELAKVAEDSGEPSGFEQYVLRIARILHIKTFVRDSETANLSGGIRWVHEVLAA